MCIHIKSTCLFTLSICLMVSLYACLFLILSLDSLEIIPGNSTSGTVEARVRGAGVITNCSLQHIMSQYAREVKPRQHHRRHVGQREWLNQSSFWTIANL